MSNINLNHKKILITGSPGFIGASLTIKLLSKLTGSLIVSLDNMNNYYDVSLKEYRLKLIEDAAKSSSSSHIFIKGSIADKEFLENVFKEYNFDIVVNLAAQAGVRYSIENPDSYIESNIIGFYNILETCRKFPPQHLIFASSSSIYGENHKVPFSTDDKTDSPVSLYAATKKSDELIAYCYSKLYDIPITGLRFFTVYGPAGRPDMFYFSMTEKLIAGEKIKIFNNGNMSRDFTFIDDIVEGILRTMKAPPKKKLVSDGSFTTPYAIYNIGCGHPEPVSRFAFVLCNELIKCHLLPEDFDFKDHIELTEIQPGDVPITFADTTSFEKDFGFVPKTSIESGLKSFAEWYTQYYNSQKK